MRTIEMKKLLTSVLLTFGVPMSIVAAANRPASGQTYTDLYNFDGTHGDHPSVSELFAQGRDGSLYATTSDGGEGCGTGCGVAFKIAPSGLNVLYNFDGVHGSDPYSGLTLGADGNFYGTTSEGGGSGCGDSGCGTIFKITPSGNLATLWAFSGGEGGAQPLAPPIWATDGNLYGTTYNYPHTGVVYKVTPSGTFTVLASLPGPSEAPLLQATDGNFYGTTAYGGDLCNCGALFKVTPNGIITIVHAFKPESGTNPSAPLIQGSDGSVYGTASLGGSYGRGVVFRLTPHGGFTVLHNFGDPQYPDDGTLPESGLVLATDGNLYGVTSSGGTSTYWGVIFRITTADDYSILYNFDFTSGGAPQSTPIQHTNGEIYGLASEGGASNDGVVYSFDLGLSPFIRLVSPTGRVGQTGGILGQGFTGTTGFFFNGTPAAFTIVSDTYLTATVPPGATTGFVSVVTPSGTLTSNQKFQVRP
jgi:uncharacterized repeat protein (TIGR03803 family)